MKLILNFLSLIIVGLIITGCTQKWVKPGAKQSDFDQDKYTCLQQSQQQFGAAKINAYGGSSINTVKTNDMLFSTCMKSKGWIMQDEEETKLQNEKIKSNDSNLTQQINKLSERGLAVCNKSELSEYYKKTACQANEISFEQITDATKITSAQKTTLLKQREEISSIDKELDSILAQAGETGKKIISVEVNFTRPENERNNLDLYNEKITWGEYNKKRKEISIEATNKRELTKNR